MSEQSASERLWAGAIIAALWVIVGCFVAAVMDRMGAPINLENWTHVAAVAVFWPVFVLKYALIGIGMVVKAFLSLIAA